MSYLTQAKLAADHNIQQRLTACAATFGVQNPGGWVYDRQWIFSAQAGWVDAYKEAVLDGDDIPGANEEAITDGMILSAVESLLAGE